MPAIEQSVIDIINSVNRIQKDFVEERQLIRLRKEYKNMEKPPKIKYDQYFRSQYQSLAEALDFNNVQFHHLLEEITKDPTRGQIADKLNEVLNEGLLFYPEATIKSNEIHQRSEEAHRVNIAAFEKRKKALEDIITAADNKIKENPAQEYTIEEASKLHREQWNKIADIFAEIFKNKIDIDTLDYSTQVLVCSVSGHSKYYMVKNNKLEGGPLHGNATGDELRSFNDSHIATICFELSIIYEMEEPSYEKLLRFPRVSNKSVEAFKSIKLFD